MSIFRKDKEVKFKRLKKAVRKDTGFVPHSDKRLSQLEKERLLDDVFGLKQDEYLVTEDEYRDKLRELELGAFDSSDWQEKEEVEARHRYLKKFL